ncbi:MAG: alpha/beta hydrolase-fold protein [Candidatus Cohnella colombiensis]|uniref:Alpha/beta hydrolase-fold protein n=1 Tax=Candidatus Cohnella colombiensis TaxID=3121368 RepID=A0AA95JAB9_9BACL|nr:MAG: alpha/beta hydrolase-fold protein [Cohnella sp.]
MKIFVAIIIISYIAMFLLSGCFGKAETPTQSHSPVQSSPITQSDEQDQLEAPSSPSPVHPTPSLIDVDSHVVTVQVHSDMLHRDMEMSVYLPAGYSKEVKYPVLYMLYGYGGTHDAWFTYLHLQDVADRLIEEGAIDPLLIVSPDYGNSFAVNSRIEDGNDPHSVDIGPYEDYLIQEVIPYVDTNYSTDASNKGRYVGGASMGGYASLYLGFNYPDLFSRIGAHSAAIWNYTSTDQFIGQRDWLYANDALRERRDPFKLAESQKLDSVEVYLDCGTGDALAEKDQALYDLLVSKGIEAEWVPSPGGHDAAYWSSQLENYLLFYSGVEQDT